MWINSLVVAIPLIVGTSVASFSARIVMPEREPGEPRPGQRAVRVLIPKVFAGEIEDHTRALEVRLQKLKFEVEIEHWDKFDPRKLKNIDVIFLPTNWAYVAGPCEHIDSRAEEVHAFVKRGGGLIVGQPNCPKTDFTPKLLPLPVTFDWRYDNTDATRVNLAHDHFVTEDLIDNEMPFPADAMTKVDKRYRVLAKQKSTGALSLAVADFGDGRVLVQTGCEAVNSMFPLSDEMLRRMVLWTAGREPKRR
jgi:hypothetical protein